MKRRTIPVRIEKLDFPNRAKGYELLDREEGSVEERLEIASGTNQQNLERGRAIVAKGGLPGQVWMAKTGRNRAGAKECKLLELLERSSLETEAGCSVCDQCGGCCYQKLSFQTELLLKGHQLRDLYREAGLFEEIPLTHSPLVHGYRNKMEYTFGDREKGGPLTLGLHRPGHFYEIIPTPDCNIVPEDFNTLRSYSQDFFRKAGLPYYHRSRRQGILRHLVLRASLTKKQLMVNLVTTFALESDDPIWAEYLQGLQGLDLEFSLASVYHTRNDSPADAVIPEELTLQWGRPYLEERLHDLQFHVGPFSFFQPNVAGAERLYAKALEFAGDLSGKTVYDLYSGTGTITQILARHARRAIGVELVEEAVEKARESAQLNELANVKWVANDVLKELDRMAREEEAPDVIVLDPPRQGIHPKALPKICAAGADRIVYISCNPITQVHDILEMEKFGYKAEKACAFDQFPRTKHVEALVLMTRIN